MEFSNHPHYEFSIKMEVSVSGKQNFTPVCREKSIFGKYLSSKWLRIVKIYNTYAIIEIDFEPELSFAECEEHIRGYKKQLEEQRSAEIAKVEFYSLQF